MSAVLTWLQTYPLIQCSQLCGLTKYDVTKALDLVCNDGEKAIAPGEINVLCQRLPLLRNAEVESFFNTQTAIEYLQVGGQRYLWKAADYWVYRQLWNR